MYDEKGERYLDCINNVAHGKHLYHYFLLISYKQQDMSWEFDNLSVGQ